MQLLIATGNPGKKVEFEQILSGLSIELFTLDSLDKHIPEPIEDGSSFSENACIKAEAYAQTTRLSTVADDSGLCIDALNGFPGVVSARWQAGSDEDRLVALLEKMKSNTDRSAQFVCSICFFDIVSNKAVTFEGVMTGSLATEPKGSNGFGYDPIFIPEGQSKTLAELSSEYKNAHSHRARALKKLRLFLQEKYAIVSP